MTRWAKNGNRHPITSDKDWDYPSHERRRHIMDCRWATVLLRPLCVALGSIAPIMPASADDRALQAGTKSVLVGATSGDAVELLHFPPPLIVEPLVPPVRPEDELERDPG